VADEGVLRQLIPGDRRMVEQPHYRAVRALNVTDDIDVGFQIPPRLPAKCLVGLLLLPLRILSCRTSVHVV